MKKFKTPSVTSDQLSLALGLALKSMFLFKYYTIVNLAGSFKASENGTLSPANQQRFNTLVDAFTEELQYRLLEELELNSNNY